jgi:hypothetical protein
MKRALLLAAALVATTASARAEIDPKYYRQWQERATEALVVRVTAVRTSTSKEKHASGGFTLVHTRVEAEAQVEKVERTGTGLKQGDTIRIQYVSTQPDRPIPGPRPIPVLKRGESYPAFLLAVSKGVYAPAAKGASFEPLIQAR